MPLTRSAFDTREAPLDSVHALGELLNVVRAISEEQGLLKEQMISVERKLDKAVTENELLRVEIADARKKIDATLNVIKEECQALRRNPEQFSTDEPSQTWTREEQNGIPNNLLEAYARYKDWEALKLGLEGVVDRDSRAFWQLQHIENYCVDPLFRIGTLGYVELAEVVLSHGVLLETTDGDGDTMLHGAAHAGELLVTRLLLSRGANVDARNIYDRTPLMRAAEQGHLQVVTCLVQAGADKSSVSKSNLTALDYARQHGHTSIVQFLSQTY